MVLLDVCVKEEVLTRVYSRFSLRSESAIPNALDRNSVARTVQKATCIQSSALCVKKYGRNGCNCGDTANRKDGQFMSRYNTKAVATVYLDSSGASLSRSSCESPLVSGLYDGLSFQYLKKKGSFLISRYTIQCIKILHTNDIDRRS